MFSAIVAAPVAADDAAEGDLKVMSFNVRYSHAGSSEAKTENNWNDPDHPRRERAARVIRDYGPDILGVQEARHPQIVDLREALAGYDFYGIGRDDGKTGGEYSGIFWRKARFTPVDSGSFWLSATPEKPGTSFYKSPRAVPRIASWVRLADKESGRDVVVLNMHWDHESESARRQSAELARVRLAELAKAGPAIVMGDLNSGEDTPALATMIGGNDAKGPKLIDSYRQLHADRDRDEATYNNWAGQTAGSRIDFILHTDHLQPVAAAIDRTAYDGRWPSDHYPVTATLRSR